MKLSHVPYYYYGFLYFNIRHIAAKRQYGSCRLIEQIAYGEHHLISGGGSRQVLEGRSVALAVYQVIVVLAVRDRQQAVACHLLEDTPVLAEEVGQIHDVETQLQGVLCLAPPQTHLTQILEV